MFPRVLSGKWLTNVLLIVLSGICTWGFNHLESNWNKYTGQTDTNTNDITLLKEHDATTIGQLGSVRLDVDLLKVQQARMDATLKNQSNERVTLSSYKPHTPFLPQASGLWANAHRSSGDTQSRGWFPLAAVFDNRCQLWAPGWLYHSSR